MLNINNLCRKIWRTGRDSNCSIVFPCTPASILPKENQPLTEFIRALNDVGRRSSGKKSGKL